MAIATFTVDNHVVDFLSAGQENVEAVQDNTGIKTLFPSVIKSQRKKELMSILWQLSMGWFLMAEGRTREAIGSKQCQKASVYTQPDYDYQDRPNSL